MPAPAGQNASIDPRPTRPRSGEIWLVTHADLRMSARVAETIRLLETLVKRSEEPPPAG